MDAKQFLQEFGHIANAPGGIARLREMIYQLAITGGLSRYESTDRSAEDLLSEVLLEKKKRIKEKRFKRSPKLENSQNYSQKDLSIPEHWVWTNLVSVGEINPKNIAEDTLSASFLPMSAISELHSEPLQPETRKWSEIKKGYTHIADGDAVIAKITPCFENGKSAVIGGLENSIGSGTTELHVFRPLPGISASYVYIFLRSPYFKGLGEQVMTGTAGQKRLPSDYFASRPLPLPPKGEQARIVEKVDELMALCDQLEQQQQKKRTLQNRLRKATLDAVATATSPFELKQHWQLLEAHFQTLFSQPEDVDDFLFCVKQLAIEGLLTPASIEKPNIEEIKTSKSELLNRYLEKKPIRKQKKAISMADSGIEYPDNWQVLAFDEIALVIGGVTKGRNLRDRKMINCPYLAVANVQRGYFELANLKRIDIAEDEVDKYSVCNGDLLITEGGDWDKVGRTAIWNQDIDNCLHQNHVFKARVPSSLVLNEWIELIFNSSIGRTYFAGASKQTTNLASINMTQLRSFPVPIPPRDEQLRILNVVSALTELSERWRRKFKRVCSLQEFFTKAVVSELTGANVNTKEEPLAIPKTELNATIRKGDINPEKNSNAPLSSLVSRANGEIQAKDLWQSSGIDIDDFYTQLKTEVVHGWLAEPEEAVMNVLEESDNNE